MCIWCRFNFVLIEGVAVIVAEVPEEHVYKAIKEICWRQLNPLLLLVEVNFSLHLSFINSLYNNITRF